MSQTGSYLGELMKELDVDDNITEFAATGLKSYIFKTAKDKITLKSEGDHAPFFKHTNRYVRKHGLPGPRLCDIT